MCKYIETHTQLHNLESRTPKHIQAHVAHIDTASSCAHILQDKPTYTLKWDNNTLEHIKPREFRDKHGHQINNKKFCFS